MEAAKVKYWAKVAQGLALRALATGGATQSESRMSADAQQHWRASDGTRRHRWEAESHWRSAEGFTDTDLWNRMGEQHLAMFERGARAVNFSRPWTRVIDWGCGGGANAVHFAPRADEFVGVDVSEASARECGRQVAAVCDTGYRPLVIDVERPEKVVDDLGAGTCDVFLCFYVLELVPTPEYGARLLHVAHELLAPGGLALVQARYSDGRWRTRPRRRSYRSGPAEMTTYSIHGFWQLAQRCGLTPELVELVPENELDERYAYFLLSRP